MKFHPDWEYRLWTDTDNRQFIATHYPDFLPIYDNYEKPICRADAARVFILKHFGGVYADLDFECLQPIDALLEDTQLLIGLEPDSHMQLAEVSGRGFKHLLSPALIAAIPGHEFWGVVISQLHLYAGLPGPLDATVPFLLSRAYAEYRGMQNIRLVEPELLHPVDKFQCWEGALFDLEQWERHTFKAYAVHH